MDLLEWSVLIEPVDHNPLTSREQEILCMTARGARQKEIARSLNASLLTIRQTAWRAREKLNAGNMTHAVLIAYREGWIELD